MNTLLLNPTSWDFLVDANGNIAMASDPYSKSQDIASAIRTWLGEVYYNQNLGINWQNIIGHNPASSYVAAQLEAAALTVPGIVKAKTTELFYDRITRKITGTVEAIDTTGAALNVSF